MVEVDEKKTSAGDIALVICRWFCLVAAVWQAFDFIINGKDVLSLYLELFPDANGPSAAILLLTAFNTLLWVLGYCWCRRFAQEKTMTFGARMTVCLVTLIVIRLLVEISLYLLLIATQYMGAATPGLLLVMIGCLGYCCYWVSKA